MKQIEKVDCEIRRVVDLRLSVSERLYTLEGDDGRASNVLQGYNNSHCVSGNFLHNATYAWLKCGSHLVVLNVKTGESISSWTFRSNVTCVCQFPARPGELPLLLVGLDNEAPRIKDSMGLLCIFDCTNSRVLRAIRMPAGVEQVCIVSGGAKWEEFNDRRLDSVLTEMDGIACVVLRNLYHIMIDLQRSTWETSNSSVIMDETLPAEIELLMEKESIRRGQTNTNKHVAYNLLNSRLEKHIGFNREEYEAATFLEENLTNTIISSMKIGCLISGCLGRVILWQNDGSIGWISSVVNDTMIITHLALLEPTDDPRPFYYLWTVFQDSSSKTPPLLRMYALLFEKKYSQGGTNLYFNLEAEPSVKFELELDTRDRIVSLSTIERETNLNQTEAETKRGEDNLLLITTTEKTLLFDLNQWYKEQMPQTMDECKNPNSILASYSTKHRSCNITDNQVISCTYIPYTLQEFPNSSPSLQEEFFYPNSLSLEWVELSLTKLTFWMSRGVQAELLREMAIAGPIILTQPSETFYRCLSVGLVPFNTEVSFASDQNSQREMLLSLCLEQRWATYLVRCAKEWSDGSAAYMYPNFLKWSVQRASSIKIIADQLCEPLFDQSGIDIGEAEIKTLRFCSQQLECLSNVMSKLSLETVDLMKQRKALRRVSIYFQVLLWFYDVGLLPETQDMETGPLPISLDLKIPYPFEKLFAVYKERRDSMKVDKEKNENEEGFFIDELIMRECPVLKLQWEREAGETANNGCYPPPSLQSLLRSYLTDCRQTELNEIEYKHQITIYLLMDLAMLLQRSYPGVDQLIKYPSAFKMSPSLIKLTQAFWLLDHEDYQGFLDMMTGQLVADSDVKDWHHRLVLRTLVRTNQHKLALTYLRIRKPPLSSIEDQSTLISLSVEHGLVQSAFHHRPQSHYTQLLICFFQACKTYGKLSDILHLALDSEEEEIFIKFLEDGATGDMRLLYYLQRCRYTEANDGNSMTRYNIACPKNTQPTSFAMLNAYNATLPDVMKRFSINMVRTNLDVDPESRYPRPMSHYKSGNKALNIYENVIRKAQETYLRSERSQIPFISAPCVSLKLSDDRANTNCVLFPKLAHENRKRTLEQMSENEYDRSEMPDGAKRRKLVDDDEEVNRTNEKEMDFNISFNTPLVKRKNTSIPNRDVTAGTPHSILKIRQLIRGSTSPSIGSSTIENPDGPSPEREKKVSRQIRFSISRSKKETTEEEVNDEENHTNLNVSQRSDDVFFSPNVSGKSSESIVLSDNSYSSKNAYSPRPRPSLRRTNLQFSNEVSEKSTRKPNFTNSAVISETLSNVSKVLSKISPTISKASNSMMSTSIYSPAVLSYDSSFESNVSPRNRCAETYLRYSPKLTTQQDINSNSADSSKFSLKSSVLKEIHESFGGAMDVDEVDVKESEVSYMERPVLPESRYIDTPDISYLQENMEEKTREGRPKEEVQSKYNNGDVTKRNTSQLRQSLKLTETNEEDDDFGDAYGEELSMNDNEEVFESLSNTRESSVFRSEKRENFDSSEEEVKDEHRLSEDCIESRNRENVDITDDESSNSADEMVLALENSNSSVKRTFNAAPTHAEKLYDDSNITDDESDCSIDAEVPEKSKSFVKMRQDANASTARTVSKVRPDNGNVTLKKGANKSKYEFIDDVESDGKASVKESMQVTFNRSSTAVRSPIVDQRVTPRMEETEETNMRVTRSRRASSISKETFSPLPMHSSPKGMTPEKVRSSRRASSLVKDVLTASILAADESIKKMVSSGSEDSTGTSSPKRIRNRRASSVAKDDSLVEKEDAEIKVPIRRSTRRAASVQKELPEMTKPLTRRSRVSSVSLISENKDEEAQVESNSVKSKDVSLNGKKSSTTPTRSARTSKGVKEKVEETNEAKSTPKRGSSVPKESVSETVRTRRSSSLAKEVVPKDSELPQEPIRKRHFQVSKVGSSTANTRSRRSSIQSIPEELEEILNMPSEGTSRPAMEDKQASRQNARQRRAASVELTSVDTKIKTRSRSSRNILKETITEEVLAETQDEITSKASKAKNTATKGKRTTSDKLVDKNVIVKPRKGRKTSVSQESTNQFSFSQPEKANDSPLDEKAIGDVPNYVFSPPHTRSKATTQDGYWE